VIKLKRIRRAGHVARRGEVIYRVLVRKREGRDHLGDPGLHGKITIRRFFRKWDAGVWTGYSWLRIGTSGGHLRMR